jgi:hypothetical protein
MGKVNEEHSWESRKKETKKIPSLPGQIKSYMKEATFQELLCD